ncbi:g10435 [Coccomyxa elongata]
MTEVSKSDGIIPPTNGDDESARKEALRKAGAEYFDKVLSKASAGKDPFLDPPKSRRKPADIEAVDPDIETVGRVLEGIRLYVIGALFLTCASVSLVLVQASLQPLHTPGIQAFLHLLPTVCGLWMLVDVGPLTKETALGVVPTAGLGALKVLCLFGALLYSDVRLVLAWITWAPPALKAGQTLLQGSKLEVQQNGLLGVGGVGLLGCMLGLWPTLLGVLSLLGWAAAEAAELAWEYWKVHSEPGVLYLGERATGLVRSMADEEAKVGATTMEFYRNSLPAVPLLVVGFLFGEGVELVQHELSVPAVMTMLCSVAAWATAAVTGVLLADSLSVPARSALKALGCIGTLIASVVIGGLGSVGGLVAAAFVVVSGVGLQMGDLVDIVGATRAALPRPASVYSGSEPHRNRGIKASAAVILAPIPAVEEEIVDARHLLNLIGITAPYLRLSSLKVQGSTAWAVVERESMDVLEIHAPMMHTEICRHAANVAEIACAAVNPVKKRHFYLAMKTEFDAATPMGAAAGTQPSGECWSGSAVEIEAVVKRFGRGLANVCIQIFRRGSPSMATPVRRQLFAEMKVNSMVVPEDTFRAKMRQAASADILSAVLQKTQALARPSPYLNPVCLSDIAAPSTNIQTAKLHFTDVHMAAGHFPDLPALPASTVGANVVHLVSLGLGDDLSRPMQLRVVRHIMKFRSLPELGETLCFTASRVACKDGITHFQGHVTVETSQRDIMLFDLHIVPEA